MQEAADYIGVSVFTIRRRISSGVLPAKRVAGGKRAAIRVNIEDVERVLLRDVPTVGKPA